MKDIPDLVRETRRNVPRPLPAVLRRTSEIDALVYDLYDLKVDEIAVVEADAGGNSP